MAVASLLNMTVPVASNSDQSAGNQGLLMPLLKYRFRVTFLNFGVTNPTTELTKQVMDFTRPNLSFTEMEIPIYNSRIYLAGKHEWQTIELVVRDDITNAVSKLVGHQVQKQLNFFEQTSVAAGINYKFNMILESLDGGNATVFDQWTLEGCFLTTINYNDKDYSSSDPVTINMTVRYENATLADGLFTTTPQFIPGVRV